MPPVNHAFTLDHYYYAQHNFSPQACSESQEYVQNDHVNILGFHDHSYVNQEEHFPDFEISDVEAPCASTASDKNNSGDFNFLTDYNLPPTGRHGKD